MKPRPFGPGTWDEDKNYLAYRHRPGCGGTIGFYDGMRLRCAEPPRGATTAVCCSCGEKYTRSRTASGKLGTWQKAARAPQPAAQARP